MDAWIRAFLKTAHKWLNDNYLLYTMYFSLESSRQVYEIYSEIQIYINSCYMLTLYICIDIYCENLVMHE